MAEFLSARKVKPEIGRMATLISAVHKPNANYVAIHTPFLIQAALLGLLYSIIL
jgi:hypothetical protein